MFQPQSEASQQSSSAKEPDIFVSVVLPVYEEQDSVGELLSDVELSLAELGHSFEIVAVDDGSSDETFASLQRFQAQRPELVVLARHLMNRGNGAALRTGIRLAKGEIVVTMDSDGQHDPKHIGELLESIPPYDLVIGARTRDYRGDWRRSLANRFYNRFASWLTQRRIDDLTSGFRAMRRQVVRHFLPLFPDGFSAPTTTTMAFLKAGYSVAFVPIPVGSRASGRSKIRLWRDGMRFVTIILRMIMLFDPLRIFLPVGLGLTLLGFAAWAAGLWNAGRLVLPNSAIFLFSAALMVGLLGLVSDQIASARVQYHGDETVEIVSKSGSEFLQ